MSFPSLITRQRQNAASALARGFDVRLRQNWRKWSGELGYLFADSRVATGERIPQVPRHTGTAQLTWFNGSTLLSAGLRAFSLQFDDDINRILLPGFVTLQFSAIQPLRAGLAATLEMENLL